MPSYAHAFNQEAIVLNQSSYKYQLALTDKQMILHLRHYAEVIKYSTDKIKTDSDQKGRKQKILEKNLTFQTYNLILKYQTETLKAYEIYQFISDFLIANGVHLPIEAENIAKMILSMKKSKNSTF